MQRVMTFGVVGVALTAMVGCGEPLVGQWRAVDDNGCPAYSTFEVEDDLSGRGTLYLLLCAECPVTFQIEDLDDGKYSAQLSSPTCQCPDGSSTASAICDLDDDEEYLYCTLRSNCYDDAETFVRVED